MNVKEADWVHGQRSNILVKSGAGSCGDFWLSERQDINYGVTHFFLLSFFRFFEPRACFVVISCGKYRLIYKMGQQYLLYRVWYCRKKFIYKITPRVCP